MVQLNGQPVLFDDRAIAGSAALVYHQPSRFRNSAAIAMGACRG